MTAVIPRRPRAAAAVVALLVLLACWAWHAHRGATVTTDPQRIRIVTEVYGGAATAAQISAALGAVRVIPSRPFPGGYDRDCDPGDGCSFGTAWSDDTSAPDGHNGCDTRDDVLREQLVEVQVAADTGGCKVLAGTLVDPYTGSLVDFARQHFDIDIDHVVPLAYAWDMGASRWSQQERDQFANDTRLELLASWGPANEDKGDSGPGAWLPPDTTFRCDYVLRFLRIAAHYALPITAADASAVRATSRGC